MGNIIFILGYIIILPLVVISIGLLYIVYYIGYVMEYCDYDFKRWKITQKLDDTIGKLLDLIFTGNSK